MLHRIDISEAQGEVSHPLLLADAEVLLRKPSTLGSQRHMCVGLGDADELSGANSSQSNIERPREVGSKRPGATTAATKRQREETSEHPGVNSPTPAYKRPRTEPSERPAVNSPTTPNKRPREEPGERPDGNSLKTATNVPEKK